MEPFIWTVLVITTNHIFCCLLMTETVESFVLASRSTCIIEIIFFCLFACTGHTIVSIFTILNVNIYSQSTFFGRRIFLRSELEPSVPFCRLFRIWIPHFHYILPLQVEKRSLPSGILIKCLTHRTCFLNSLAYYICDFRMHCTLWNIKMVLFRVIAKRCHLLIHLITVYTVKQLKFNGPFVEVYAIGLKLLSDANSDIIYLCGWILKEWDGKWMITNTDQFVSWEILVSHESGASR